MKFISEVFDEDYLIEKAFYLVKDGRLFNCVEVEALASSVFFKEHFFVSRFCAEGIPSGFSLDIEI